VSAEITIQKYLEGFNAGDARALASLYAPTTAYSNPFAAAPATTPAQVEAFEAPMFAAFTDVHAQIDQLIADGDRAAASVTIRATHTGELQTPAGAVPPTGRTITLHSAEFVTVDDRDTIVEHVRIFDTGSFLAQLGLR
jgi:steroid delta-isomerase-like uncharacterized protein